MLVGGSMYNGGVPGDTSTQIKDRMTADTVRRPLPVVIWAGRNNFSDPTTVLADIAIMVASLGHTHYLVLSVTNGDTTTEYSGGAGYINIATINASLASTYGAHYVDVRSHLVSLYDPNNAQDVIDHGNDIPPSSLRINASHFNDAGYRAIANKVYESISILNP